MNSYLQVWKFAVCVCVCGLLYSSSHCHWLFLLCTMVAILWSTIWCLVGISWHLFFIRLNLDLHLRYAHFWHMSWFCLTFWGIDTGVGCWYWRGLL